MGKWVADRVLDGALQVIMGADRLVALAGQPADYAEAHETRLAEVALSGPDFSVAAGALSGRRVQVAAKTGVAVAASGTADHVALLDGAGERLLYVTTCPAQLLGLGGTVDFEAWSIEIGAPL